MDIFATAVAWLPFLAIAIACGVLVLSGIAHLEANSAGTSYFVPSVGEKHLHPADWSDPTVDGSTLG